MRPVGVITDPGTLEIGNDTTWQVNSWKNARKVAAKENAYWAVLVEEAKAVHDCHLDDRELFGQCTPCAGGFRTTYEERVMLDVYYIHHGSPWLDLYLLAKTVKTVLFTKGAY